MTLFDRLDFGVAFCRANGRILFANRSFTAMAADRDGTTDPGKVAGAVHEGDLRALAAMHAGAPNPRTPHDRLVAAIRRRSGQLPLIVKAMPVRETDIRRSDTTRLIVLDPEDRTRLNALGLTAFGLLTEAEQEDFEMLVQGPSAPKSHCGSTPPRKRPKANPRRSLPSWHAGPCWTL